MWEEVRDDVFVSFFSVLSFLVLFVFFCAGLGGARVIGTGMWARHGGHTMKTLPIGMGE